MSRKYQQPDWASSYNNLKLLVGAEANRSTIQAPTHFVSNYFQTEQSRNEQSQAKTPTSTEPSEMQKYAPRQDLHSYRMLTSSPSRDFTKEGSTNMSPRDMELRVNLQTAFNRHALKYKYTSSTTVGELVKYLRDIAGSKQILLRSGNCMLDYALTLERQRVSVLATMQPLNIMIEPITQLSGLADNSLKRFNVIRCIGSGGFSRVFLAEVYGVYVALKVIDKEFLISSEKEVIVENEKKILVELNHPFITKVHYTIETEKKIAIALEYCSGGELFYLLKKVKRMRESEARFYFLEVLSALKALHDRSMVYRDLKPQNIILDYQGHVRLADFGLSKIMEDEFTHSFCGSAEYMAPEMLERGGHNFSVDHYCIGALLYELVTGLPPYYSKDQNQLFHNILNNELEFPERFVLSYEIKALLSQLLVKDPSRRLGNSRGISEIWQHPWVMGISEEDVLAKKLNPPFRPNIFQENFDNTEFKTDEAQAMKELQTQKLHGDLRKPCLNSFFFQSEQMKRRKQQLGKEPKARPVSPFSEHNVDLAKTKQQGINTVKENLYRPARPISPNISQKVYGDPSPRRQPPSTATLLRDGSFQRAFPELIRYKSQGQLITSLKGDSQNLSTRYPSKEFDYHRRDASANKARRDELLHYNRSHELRRSLEGRQYDNSPRRMFGEQHRRTPYIGITSSINLSTSKRPQSHRKAEASIRRPRQSPPRANKPSYPTMDPSKRQLRKGYYNKQKLRNYFSKKY